MRAFVLYESRLKHWDRWLSQQFLGPFRIIVSVNVLQELVAN